MGIFGKKPQYIPQQQVAPPAPRQAGPSVDQAIHNAELRVNNLESRVQALDIEIANHKREMQRSRPGTSSHTMHKRRALNAMRQRKALEGRASTQANATFNLEQVREAQQMQHDNVAFVQGMRAAKQDIQAAQGHIDLDEVEDLQDDMQEALADVNEVGDILGRSYDVDHVDQSELEAELNELEEDSIGYATGGELQTPSYIAPAPYHTPAISAPQHDQVQHQQPPSHAYPQGMPANRY